MKLHWTTIGWIAVGFLAAAALLSFKPAPLTTCPSSPQGGQIDLSNNTFDFGGGFDLGGFFDLSLNSIGDPVSSESAIQRENVGNRTYATCDASAMLATIVSHRIQLGEPTDLASMGFTTKVDEKFFTRFPCEAMQDSLVALEARLLN